LHISFRVFHFVFNSHVFALTTNTSVYHVRAPNTRDVTKALEDALEALEDALEALEDARSDPHSRKAVPLPNDIRADMQFGTFAKANLTSSE
jgi:hypothetical protein